MFSMHERTQRKVCRMAFVLVCAVPTVLTLGWVLYFHRPWHEQDWRHYLENTLHVRVAVDAVSAPRPFERSVQSVRLSDLQTAEPLVEFQGIKVATKNSLTVASATAHWQQVVEISQTLPLWLGSESFMPSHWQIEQLTIVNSSGATCGLHNIRCETKFGLNGSRQCTLEARHRDKPVRLLVELNPDGKVQSTIDSQQAALPAWLLADGVPGGSRWSSATFTGTIRLQKQRSQLVGELRGHVDSINIQEWIGSDQLQTTAKLQLDSLSWRNGRIETIHGFLEAADARISHALLVLLKEKFLCTIALDESQLNNKEQYQQIDRLGCRFQLNSEGLAISGMYAWGDTSKGCVITAAGKPLVSIPGRPTLPLAQLVQLVSPHDPYWFPANREASNLAEKLPLPEAKTEKK
jgi:hypothetical protein